MTREGLSRNYWRYYRMLEDKFLATTNYVEINAESKEEVKRNRLSNDNI